MRESFRLIKKVWWHFNKNPKNTSEKQICHFFDRLRPAAGSKPSTRLLSVRLVELHILKKYEEYVPEEDDVVLFSGKHYMQAPKEERRIVIVSTIYQYIGKLND